MELTKLKLEYELCEKHNNAMPAIIVAAGCSSRMNGVNKQTALLCGIPVLARTLLAFENSGAVSNIILVTRSNDMLDAQILAERYGISKLTDIICGGDTREESVARGIAVLKKNDEFVLIHDGARPLVTAEIISGVANALKSCSAVTCAVPLKDTVKRVDKNGIVTETPDRSSLFAVQTPQGVRVEEFKTAIEKASRDLTNFTDDMSVMEAAGYTVHITNGSYKNIKITTPEDIMLAEYLLNGENKE